MGLLLLRLSLALTGIAQGLSSIPDATLPARCFAAATVAAGLLLAAGLFTPILSVTVSAAAVCVALSIFPAASEGLLKGHFAAVMVAAVGISLALVGPGEFSLDFRLFGRREIIIPRATREKP
jgi:uncharacterized membrane protein YphA (DoxX/SURF4 family)